MKPTTNTLKIPLIRQVSGTDDCLRCCGLMVFHYHDDHITQQELWKELPIYKNAGAYMTDLGRAALKRGFKAIIYHYDWHWWNQKAIKSSKAGATSLIVSLKSLKKSKKGLKDRRIIDKEISFLRAGGFFRIKPTTQAIIDAQLKKGNPPIISVRGQGLYQDSKQDYLHAIVVIGKEKGRYLIRDPYRNLTSVDAQNLVHSWIRAGGWMLALTQ